jgi:hypothetical protein
MGKRMETDQTVLEMVTEMEMGTVARMGMVVETVAAMVAVETEAVESK